VTVHIMPYLISLNINSREASLVASLLILVSTVGRFSFGWFSNKIDNRYLFSLGIMLQAAGVLFLLWAKNTWGIILFLVTFGPAFGGVITLRVTLQSQIFGRHSFGTIQGAFMAIMMVGTIASPLLTGWCFDLYGDYSLAWVALAAINVAAIPVTLKLKAPLRE